MSAVAFGIGLSGIFVNFIRIATIAVGIQFENLDPFYPTIAFLGIILFINFCAAAMYFVEKQNKYAKEVNKKAADLIKTQKQQSMLDIIYSCKEAKTSLAYLLWVYVVTFIVFPGVTNGTKSFVIDYEGPWFQIIMTTLFNFFDTIGRYIGGNKKYFCSKFTMKVLAHLRLLNVILFILCYLKRDDFLLSYTGDVIKFLNLAIFAFSNGYLQTLCCIWAPSEITDAKKRDKVGQMVTLIINIGIMIGCLISITLS